MKLKTLLFLVISLFAAMVFAEEGVEVHEAGIPRIVFFQALNFFRTSCDHLFFGEKEGQCVFCKTSR